jgi:hypothetical protein
MTTPRDVREVLSDVAARGPLWQAVTHRARLDRLRASAGAGLDLFPGPVHKSGASSSEKERPRARSDVSGDDGASFLESLCISDPPRSCFLGAEDTWLAGVEAATAPHREARARAHDERARDALLQWPLTSELTSELRASGELLDLPIGEETIYVRVEALVRARRAARWHRGRARGALERFARVTECGRGTIVATCVSGCGVEWRVPAHCQVGRLCVACRSRSANVRRRAFSQARVAAVLAADRRGLLRRGARDRWSEKFLTLTLPDGDVVADRWELESVGPRAEVARRVRLLLDAWRFFSLSLQRWARAYLRRTGTRIVWHRSFEWTPGADGGGHPHFHVWMLCPFLPHETIVRWWRRALARVDLRVDGPLIVDIREVVTRPHELVRELVKGGGNNLRIVGTGGDVVYRYCEGWTIVDIDQTGKRDAPARITSDVGARLYEALDGGRRLTQAARGFLDPHVSACPFCSAEGSTSTVYFAPKPSDERGKVECGAVHCGARSPPTGDLPAGG